MRYVPRPRHKPRRAEPTLRLGPGRQPAAAHRRRRPPDPLRIHRAQRTGPAHPPRRHQCALHLRQPRAPYRRNQRKRRAIPLCLRSRRPPRQPHRLLRPQLIAGSPSLHLDLAIWGYRFLDALESTQRPFFPRHRKIGTHYPKPPQTTRTRCPAKAFLGASNNRPG